MAPVLAEGRFWGLTAAFTLASVATVATGVHVIPYLTERHYSPTTAGVVVGLIGLMQLPGRMSFGPMRRALSWPWAAAVVFLLQAGAIALLTLAPHIAGLAAFVCGFGMGNGMCTLLRASTLAELYGSSRYGRVSGVLALFSTVGRAAGPLAASLALTAWRGYGPTFAALAGMLVAAGVLVLVPWRLPSLGEAGVAAHPLPKL
jgi:MFS family permease